MESLSSNRYPNHWVMIMLIWFLLFICVVKCTAQKQTAIYDTCYCNINCIEKFIQQQSASGKSTRIYAIYNDYKNDISELIPVSKSVFEYISLCETHKIKPQLGIKLRNGQIVSIIKYRKKYGKKK